MPALLPLRGGSAECAVREGFLERFFLPSAGGAGAPARSGSTWAGTASARPAPWFGAMLAGAGGGGGGGGGGAKAAGVAPGSVRMGSGVGCLERTSAPRGSCPNTTGLGSTALGSTAADDNPLGGRWPAACVADRAEDVHATPPAALAAPPDGGLGAGSSPVALLAGDDEDEGAWGSTRPDGGLAGLAREVRFAREASIEHELG